MILLSEVAEQLLNKILYENNFKTKIGERLTITATLRTDHHLENEVDDRLEIKIERDHTNL